MPKARKASIREMPVTMSELSMGMLLMPMTMFFGVFFIPFMPTAAAVPRMVDTRAEMKAMSRVLYRASMIEALPNIWIYQSRVKPPQDVLDLEVLKDSTIMVRMGAYRNMSTNTR